MDPLTHNSKRTEFRIPSRVFLSNMRLIDVGIWRTGGADVFYPSTSGVAELYKNITLLSGNTVIADCREVSSYAAFKNLQSSNDTQQSVNQRLQLTELGKVAQYQQLSGNPWDDGHVNAVDRSQTSRNIVAATEDGTAKGRVRLGEFLEFLNSLPYLPYIPDLRLVLEYNNMLDDNRLQYTTKPTGYSIVRPTLVIDELVDAKALASVSPDVNAVYFNVIQDRLRLSSGANATIEKLRTRIQAFDGKYLKDLILAVVPDAVDVRAREQLNLSQQQHLEKCNFSLNSFKYLPADGADTPARKMFYLKNSRGALEVPLNQYQVERDQKWKILGENTYDLVGKMAYSCFSFEDEIQRLDIDFQRTRSNLKTGLANAADLLMFGRVRRELSIKGGKVVTAF